MACEPARHHGDVDDRDEDEAADEVGAREVGCDPGERDAHHDEENRVEDVGEDRPERGSQDPRTERQVRGGEPGDDDAANDDGQNARSPDHLGEEEGDERGGQGGDRRQHGVVDNGADADADLGDDGADEGADTDPSPEGQEELARDEAGRDIGGVLRGLKGDGEDDQGGAVVEKRLGLEDGAAVGVDAAAQAGDGGGVGGAEAGSDQERGTQTQARQDTDEGDEGGCDGDEDRGAEDDAAQAAPHTVEGDGQRLPVQEDRQEDREHHGAGQVHLLTHWEQGDAHAGGDEKYRGDEAEPVGDRVGDN